MHDEEDLNAVFAALAHETRRRILDLLKARPGLSVGEVADRFEISRIAIMKHLAMLEKANLIVSEKDGRSRRLYFNAAPISAVYDRWTDEYTDHWAGEIMRLKRAAERRAGGVAKKKQKTRSAR
jgi:DNA-binding transcriptional ArsR family regulator